MVNKHSDSGTSVAIYVTGTQIRWKMFRHTLLYFINKRNRNSSDGELRASSREGFTADHVTMQTHFHYFALATLVEARSNHGSNSGKFLWLSSSILERWSDVVLLWQVPVNFVAAHEDTVWYSARSPRCPIAGGACCLSSRTPTCSRPSALIFSPSGLITQPLPTVFISPCIRVLIKT